MTLEEKARKLQWTFYHGTGGDESELQFLERMLREWIEEDRKARECCKAERDEAIKEIVEIINDVDIHTRKEILEEIDKIRARSDS